MGLSKVRNMHLYLLLVILGSIVPVNGGLNNRMGKVIGYLESSFVFLTTGAIVLGLVILMGLTPGNIGLIRTVPKVTFISGILNVVFVINSTWLVGKVGSGTTMVLVFLGQIVTGLLLDHFALFGLDQRPISDLRLAGVAVLVLGAYMVTRG